MIPSGRTDRGLRLSRLRWPGTSRRLGAVLWERRTVALEGFAGRLQNGGTLRGEEAAVAFILPSSSRGKRRGAEGGGEAVRVSSRAGKSALPPISRKHRWG